MGTGTEPELERAGPVSPAVELAWGPWWVKMGDMELLRQPSDFDRLLAEPLAIVFKHSTTCGISAQAHRETERFLAEHPDQVIHKVEVAESRAVSDHIEAKTGVHHESPQLLVLRDGEVVWQGSHSRITAEAIATSLS